MRDRLNAYRQRDYENAHAAPYEAPPCPAGALRIAVFVNEFPALSETFVLNQITGLLDLGHDVTIFATRPRVETRVHRDVMRYRLWERLCYRGMPGSRLARLVQMPGLLAKHRDDRGPFAKALNPMRYGREATSLGMLYWADRLAGHAPFDIIHCHFGIVGRTVAYLREVGAISGKLVTAFHGVDMSTCLDRDPGLYTHLFAHGDLFMPVSEHWRKRLVAHGCDPDRIVTHRMGIDPARFPHGDRKPSAEGPATVLTIGRLVEKKGVEFGLRAVAKLAARGVPLRYEIVGDGPLRDGLQDIARALGIAGRVRFHGARVQEDVARLMRQSDVFLAPSVTDAQGDQEGIPVTIMEAMATGMPVVSSRHSGIPELVEDGIDGLLLPERDVDGLADALASLLGAPDRCRAMGKAARGKVLAGYNIETLNRDLEGHFRALA
jgi:colanic acid/amylovoran biosynthesis glycosyltransferase